MMGRMSATATFDFTGSTTLITGGATGIGAACAEAISAAGGAVIIGVHHRPPRPAAESATPRAEVSLDVGDEASVRQCLADAAAQAQAWGRPLRYVIHAAGISPNTPFDEQDAAEWDLVLRVNTTGAFLVTKHAAPVLRANDPQSWGGGTRRGAIVLVTSTNGVNSNDPVSAHYDASKAAKNMLVRNAAMHLAGDQIMVNGLAPGWVDTSLNDTLPPDLREQENARIWTGRWADPEEMAQATLHLLTMPYLTGQVVLVDGGYA